MDLSARALISGPAAIPPPRMVGLALWGAALILAALSSISGGASAAPVTLKVYSDYV